MHKSQMTRVLVALLVVAVGSLSLHGCSSKTKTGAGIGAAAGAAVGAIIGNQSDNKGKGAAIGAATGAVVGGFIGRYMDEQAEELAEIEGAEAERVGDGIRVTWDSAILFDFDQSALRTMSKDNIEKMGDVFTKYPDTEIVVAGHTDSQGSETYNQSLSENRAKSVAEYLVTKGVTGSRITTMGYGESQPVANNDSADGRQQNRRVEIIIRPNAELRARAAEEDGK